MQLKVYKQIKQDINPTFLLHSKKIYTFPKKWYIFGVMFYEDKIDGNVRVTIVGQNTSGFTMAYAKDSETVIDAELSALPSDENGTLVII